jgi:hypothetical protein
VKVSLLNPQQALSLGRGNAASCANPAIAVTNADGSVGWLADVPQRFGVPEVTHKVRCTQTRISDISIGYLVICYAIRGAK